MMYSNSKCWIQFIYYYLKASQGAQLVKKNPCANAEDTSSIPGSRRSPGEGNGNPLQYSCLEKPLDRRAWRATVRGVAKSWTPLSYFTSTHTHAQYYHIINTGSIKCRVFICVGLCVRRPEASNLQWILPTQGSNLHLLHWQEDSLPLGHQLNG